MSKHAKERSSETNSLAPVFGGGNGFDEAEDKAWGIVPRVLESIRDSKVTKDSIELMRERANTMIDKEYS